MEARRGCEPASRPPFPQAQYLLPSLPPPPLPLLSATVSSFVEGLFDMTRDVKAVKQHLRDFLLLVLEFKGENDEAELFAEEKSEAQRQAQAAEMERRRAIPGLLNPYQRDAGEDDL